MAKEYDALLPRTQPDSEEEIHEEHFEDQSKQFKEWIIVDSIEEALQGPLVEDITEELRDIDIEDEKLLQVYFESNNTCIADLPHESLLYDKSQIEEGLPIAY